MQAGKIYDVTSIAGEYWDEVLKPMTDPFNEFPEWIHDKARERYLVDACANSEAVVQLIEWKESQ